MLTLLGWTRSAANAMASLAHPSYCSLLETPPSSQRPAQGGSGMRRCAPASLHQPAGDRCLLLQGLPTEAEPVPKAGQGMGTTLRPEP